MFVEERQDLILQELREKGSVRVKDLSKRFDVTQDLIRKDLNVLEKAGKCKKIYGGAIPVKENVQRKTASSRKSLNREQKQKIAKKAVSLIQKGNVVFLDISTTVVELAREILEKNLPITVVTNSLDAVHLFVNSDINVIFVGGEFDYGKDGFVGSLANETLKKFHFDIAFLGVVGVDLEDNAIYTYMANDGVTKQVVLSRSKQTYVLADLEKFTQIGNYQYATLEDLTGVITDQKLSANYIRYCKKYGLDVIE